MVLVDAAPKIFEELTSCAHLATARATEFCARGGGLTDSVMRQVCADAVHKATSVALEKLQEKPELFKVKPFETPQNPLFVMRSLMTYQQEGKPLETHVKNSLDQGLTAGSDVCMHNVYAAERPFGEREYNKQSKHLRRHYQDRTLKKNAKACGKTVEDAITRQEFCTKRRIYENNILYPLPDDTAKAIREKALALAAKK